MKLVKKVFALGMIYAVVMVGTFIWMWRINSLEQNNQEKDLSIVYYVE